jgi:hypothetical protein
MFKTVDKIIFTIVFISIILIIGYMVINKGNNKPVHGIVTEAKYVYDTDIKNDAYIKSNLTSQQLAVFDIILEQEKANGSLKLSNEALIKIAKNDNELVGAYLRWRNCREMMRSDNRTFYPSERKLFGFKK